MKVNIKDVKWIKFIINQYSRHKINQNNGKQNIYICSLGKFKFSCHRFSASNISKKLSYTLSNVYIHSTESSYTRVVFYISGLKKQQQMLYVCMSLNQLSKHFCHSDWAVSKTCILYASTASAGVEKRWTLSLYITYGNKKKSFGAKSELYRRWHNKSKFWVLKNAVVSADLWQLALSWWRESRFRRLSLLIS